MSEWNIWPHKFGTPVAGLQFFDSMPTDIHATTAGVTDVSSPTILFPDTFGRTRQDVDHIKQLSAWTVRAERVQKILDIPDSRKKSVKI